VKRIVWYSYATVRVVPRVERGEFLNVGVILFAREQEFLGAHIEVDHDRLRSLWPNLDIDAVERHLQAFKAVCAGDPSGGPVSALPTPERFHWLVAPRSTVIQTSPVHVGRSDDPARALDSVLDELVRPALALDQEGAGA
jgi:hypothetical protein